MKTINMQCQKHKMGSRVVEGRRKWEEKSVVKANQRQNSNERKEHVLVVPNKGQV